MITQEAFRAILADGTKCVEGDISWKRAASGSPAFTFRVNVRSEPGWPIFAEAWWNPNSEKLSYALIHREEGRIVGLDLGRSHRNPDGAQVGPKHKHRWSGEERDKEAYAPADITEPWSRPVEVWEQFCAEVKIDHNGTMPAPPWQEELLL